MGLAFIYFSQKMLGPPKDKVKELPLAEQLIQKLKEPKISVHQNTRLEKVTSAEILKVIEASPAKITVVNLWATWCEPCKEEFPYLTQLREKFKDQGLALKLVSADTMGSLPQVHEFLAEQKVDFLTYIKNEEDNKFIGAIYPEWSGALPATIIYGPGGKILKFWMGEAPYEKFESAVKPFLQ